MKTCGDNTTVIICFWLVWGLWMWAQQGQVLCQAIIGLSAGEAGRVREQGCRRSWDCLSLCSAASLWPSCPEALRRSSSRQKLLHQCKGTWLHGVSTTAGSIFPLQLWFSSAQVLQLFLLGLWKMTERHVVLRWFPGNMESTWLIAVDKVVDHKQRFSVCQRTVFSIRWGNMATHQKSRVI